MYTHTSCPSQIYPAASGYCLYLPCAAPPVSPVPLLYLSSRYTFGFCLELMTYWLFLIYHYSDFLLITLTFTAAPPVPLLYLYFPLLLGTAMRGGRGLACHKDFFNFLFIQKPSRITPWLSKRILHIIWALYCVYIVVEVTLNRAEYGSRRSQQPANVNFRPIIRGLKSDIFDWDQV